MSFTKMLHIAHYLLEANYSPTLQLKGAVHKRRPHKFAKN